MASTIEVDYAVLMWMVIILFGMVGYFRGWWKEGLTTGFLTLLIVLLKFPGLAELIVNTTNKILKILYVVIVARSLDIERLAEVAGEIEEIPIRIDPTDYRVYIFGLIGVLIVSYIAGKISVDKKVIGPSFLGSLGGGIFGLLNGFTVISLLREYMIGHYLPGATVPVEVPIAMVVIVQNTPAASIVEERVPWLIIVIGALLLWTAIWTSTFWQAISDYSIVRSLRQGLTRIWTSMRQAIYSIVQSLRQGLVRRLQVIPGYSTVQSLHQRLARRLQVIPGYKRAETREELELLREVALVAKVTEPREGLSRIVRSANRFMSSDFSMICPYDQKKEEFLYDLVVVDGQKGDLHWPVGFGMSGIRDEIMTAGTDLIMVEDLDRRPDIAGDFIKQERVKSLARVPFRVEDVVGILYVGFRTFHHFSESERRTIQLLASLAALTIQNARLYEDKERNLMRRGKELEALRAVDQAIGAGARAPDLQSVLEFILDQGMEIVGAPVGSIMWFNRWEGILELRAERGFPQDQLTIRYKLGEGIIGLAAAKKESILVPDVTAGEWVWVYIRVAPDTRSELVVPIVDESGLLGVINMEHPQVGAFSQDDQALLETLAVQAIIAIHSVELYQKLDRQIESLGALSTIATRIQDMRYTLDTVLRLLLTGVTAREGLGFSRAMLFLTDDEGLKLQGKMAIGAQTRQEAEASWRRLYEEADNVRARWGDVLTLLLHQAEAFDIAVKERRESDRPLSVAVQSISLPIEESAGALATCVLEGVPIIVNDAHPDPFRRIIEQVSQSGDTGRAFACVPLIGKGKAIGALVVDNRFLVSEREIDEGAINSLEAFAGVMAMSIENARLQARLTEEQRLATWKEFTARVAHIIGTRIMVIEGTVTQLRSCLLEEKAVKAKQLESTKALLRELTEGIRKANTVLTVFRQFATPLELQFEKLDLAQILRGVIQEVRHSVDCPIESILPSAPLVSQGDPLRLSDAFIELIRNAQEAVQQETGRAPRITITASAEASSAVSGTVARIEFTDTGPGIPKADKKRVFEPFFSKKGRGSGLGLTVVKSIIEEHRGTIEEVGIPGKGARFVVRLPMIE